MTGDELRIIEAGDVYDILADDVRTVDGIASRLGLSIDIVQVFLEALEESGRIVSINDEWRAVQ